MKHDPNGIRPESAVHESEAIRIGLITRLWIRMACADPRLACSAGIDIIALKNIGIQLLLVFALVFLVHGYALYILADGELMVSLPIAFLTAAIIISVDRSFLSHDYVLEGELKDALDAGRSVATLWAKRLAYGIGRICIAVFLAFCSAVIVILGIFPNALAEINHDKERVRNAPFYEAVNRYDDEQSEQRQIKVLNIATFDDRINAISIELSQLSNNEPTRPLPLSTQVPSQAEIDLAQEASALEEGALVAKNEANRLIACANAEREGASLPAICTEIPPSGAPGCGRNCKTLEALSEKKSLESADKESRANVLRNRLDTLKNQRVAAVGASHNEALLAWQDEHSSWVNRKSELDAELHRLSDEKDAAQVELTEFDATRAARREAKLDEFKEAGLYRDTGIGGLHRAFQGNEQLLSELSDETRADISMLKYAVVVLELAILFSRLLSATPIYSSLAYQEVRRLTSGRKTGASDQ